LHPNFNPQTNRKATGANCRSSIWESVSDWSWQRVEGKQGEIIHSGIQMSRVNLKGSHQRCPDGTKMCLVKFSNFSNDLIDFPLSWQLRKLRQMT
jgi:hypothetical protein